MTHDQAVQTMAAERYLLEEMSEIERYRFEEHFFECEECADAMRLGHQLRTEARTLFEAAPSAAATAVPSRSPRWSVRTIVPWAAAAVLALALVGQVRQTPPAVAPDSAAAYVPALLRPASRGQVPKVSVPAEGAVVLSLDVNIGTPGSAIAYRLARDGGAEAASGRAIVPPAGAPLVLVVAAERLRPEGAYLVTLTTEGDGGPPAEYRFTTAAQ
jgi:hypothetical protein